MHVMRETGEPGDGDAELAMLLEGQISRQFALHERERPVTSAAPLLISSTECGRFQLHPIDAGFVLVSLQAPQRVIEAAVLGIAGIALRHDDEIRIESRSRMSTAAR